MNTQVAIYKITNVLNGRMYIGQSIDPARRMQVHFSPKNKCIKLANAIAKYGKENFVWAVLCWCVDKKDANEVEELLIALGNTRAEGYNVTPGGSGTGVGSDNPFFGKTHSPEVKALISKAHKGKPLPLSARQKIGLATRNRVMSEATKDKLRARPKSEFCSLRTAEANKNRVWTAEAKAKLAAHNLGKKMSEEARAKIAAANSRRVWTAESRAKLAASKTKAKP